MTIFFGGMADFAIRNILVWFDDCFGTEYL